MSLSLSDLGQVVNHDVIDEAILLGSGDLQLLVAYSRCGKTDLSLYIYNVSLPYEFGSLFHSDAQDNSLSLMSMHHLSRF